MANVPPACVATTATASTAFPLSEVPQTRVPVPVVVERKVR
jgi:hypothetical protein